jgi:nicotinamide mononucleotide transporter
MDSLLAAAQPLLAPAFVVWGAAVTWLEIAAFVLSIAMVLANFRVNPIAWPLAITSSLLYGLLFVHSKLYGEASLQLVFVAVAAWGWWLWLRPVAAHRLQVRYLSPRLRVLAAAATLSAWPLLGLLLAHATDSDVPYLDALPTVASVTAQILLGRKLVDNWPLWVVVNTLSVGLFAYKGLWLTVVLYSLFTLMSLWGWRVWHRLAKP